MNEDLFKRGLRTLAEDAVPEDGSLERLLAKRRRREARRRVTGAMATVAVIGALSVIGLQLRPGGEPSPPLGSADPTPGPDATDRQIAYSVDGDVYLLDANGETRRITEDGSYEDGGSLDSLPVLRNGSRLWWVASGSAGGPGEQGPPDAVWEMDLTTGDRRVLLETDGRVQALDAGKDGGRLALVVAGAGSVQRVFVLDLDDPRAAAAEDPSARWRLAEERWVFPGYLGRGTTSEDEVSVAWSPDGSTLLVVNTFVDGGPERGDETLLVLDADGEAVQAPRHGTFGRWLDDDEVLYREIADDAWRVLDVVTGQSRAFSGLPSTGVAPSVSPDGRRIVVQDERSSPSLPRLFAVEVETGRPLLEATFEGLWPVWLDAGTILATAVEACEGDCVEPWRRLPETFSVSLADQKQSPHGVSGTFDIDVWSGPIGDGE